MGIALSKSVCFERDVGNVFVQNPGKDGLAVVWQQFFPLHLLPPLPGRGTGYWTEPWCGIVTVGLLCTVFVSGTMNLASSQPSEAYTSAYVNLIWLWATLAILSTSYIVFGGGGVINRSETNCYPIPDAVLKRLQKNEQQMTDMINIIDGQYSYCVRCFLWRKDDFKKAHHCNTCQRCVRGFDHHCSVFGRCIAQANKLCFVMNFFALFAAILTVGAACVTSTPYHHEDVHVPFFFQDFAYTTVQPLESDVASALESGNKASYVLP